MSEDPLVPPVNTIFDGSTSVTEFMTVGENFVADFLIQRSKLTPNDKVLDIGCGNGQKARPLTRYLAANGSYDGLDVVSTGISWCQEHYREYSNFHFELADIYNKHYNPGGRYQAEEYRFPYPDASFDLVLLSSVFTHMLPEGVQAYFSEIWRVLTIGGRCVITYFLLNPEALACHSAGLATIKFPFDYKSKPYRLADEEVPEKTVAYDEVFIRNLYTENKLSITEITYGSWSGRPEFRNQLQDTVIAMKWAGGEDERPESRNEQP